MNYLYIGIFYCILFSLYLFVQAGQMDIGKSIFYFLYIVDYFFMPAKKEEKSNRCFFYYSFYESQNNVYYYKQKVKFCQY